MSLSPIRTDTTCARTTSFPTPFTPKHAPNGRDSIASDELTPKRLDMNGFTLQSPDTSKSGTVNPDTLKIYEKNGTTYCELPPNATKLDLSPFSELITDEILSEIVETCPNLDSLSLTKCRLVSPVGIHSLGALRKLNTLSLGGFLHLTVKHIVALECAKRSLQFLSLAGCTKMGEEEICALAGRQGLRFLDLSGCTQLAPGHIQHLARLNSLEQLNLEGCTQVDDSFIGTLATLAPKIILLPSNPFTQFGEAVFQTYTEIVALIVHTPLHKLIDEAKAIVQGITSFNKDSVNTLTPFLEIEKMYQEMLATIEKHRALSHFKPKAEQIASILTSIHQEEHARLQSISVLVSTYHQIVALMEDNRLASLECLLKQATHFVSTLTTVEGKDIQTLLYTLEAGMAAIQDCSRVRKKTRGKNANEFLKAAREFKRVKGDF